MTICYILYSTLRSLLMYDIMSHMYAHHNKVLYKVDSNVMLEPPNKKNILLR